MKKEIKKIDKFKKLVDEKNFSIIAWDYECFSVYEGKKTVDTVSEKDKPIIEFDGRDSNGYMPCLITLLVKFLGGTTDSI